MSNPFAGYRITSPYGPRVHPVTGIPHFHTGIDLVKAHKAPIPAFVPGEVVHARNGVVGTGFGNMGNVVAIKDRNGCLHCYVHLDSVSVKVGQMVKQGQEIGKQGNTGKYSTGSHLHYEVRKKSSPSFGWIESEKDRCHEPTQYLIDYYAKEREDVDEMKALEEIAKLQKEIDNLKKKQSMPCPDWARPAIEAAQRTIGPDGNPIVIDADGGSYDFYRIISVMHRAGLIGRGD